MQTQLFDEAQMHFNEPILLGFNLGRCVGYGEDDDDCYLIVKFPDRPSYTRHTFVGGYTYLDCLKTQNLVTATNGEVWSDFTRLDNLLELNGASKESEMVLENFRR